PAIHGTLGKIFLERDEVICGAREIPPAKCWPGRGLAVRAKFLPAIADFGRLLSAVALWLMGRCASWLFDIFAASLDARGRQDLTAACPRMSQNVPSPPMISTAGRS